MAVGSLKPITKLALSAALAVALAGGALIWWHWQQGAPKRAALAVVEVLASALEDASALERPLQFLVLPQALQSRTPAEQAEFIRKALRDELSPEGLAVLKKQGAFGPLLEVFPQEATNWVAQAGVKPEDCVAFKLERNGQRSEVVLARAPGSPLAVRPSSLPSYRIVRVNNVKQLAAPITATASQRP